MHAELKKKWLEALRSGKYKQGRTNLRDRCDNYCCLGVLRDVMGCTWTPHDMNDSVYTTELHETCLLSAKTLCETNLFSRENNLTFLNDTELRTFTEIANWIEANIGETV